MASSCKARSNDGKLPGRLARLFKTWTILPLKSIPVYYYITTLNFLFLSFCEQLPGERRLRQGRLRRLLLLPSRRDALRFVGAGAGEPGPPDQVVLQVLPGQVPPQLRLPAAVQGGGGAVVVVVVVVGGGGGCGGGGGDREEELVRAVPARGEELRQGPAQGHPVDQVRSQAALPAWRRRRRGVGPGQPGPQAHPAALRQRRRRGQAAQGGEPSERGLLLMLLSFNLTLRHYTEIML